METASCPLCLAASVRFFAAAHGRRYYACDVCGLIHLSPADRLSPEAERAHYGTHENDPADVRYRAFLDRLAAPLAARLPPGAAGLDYGSGPGPTLSVMLEERGFDVTLYDPFFAPHAEALARTYDFITCTETAEHFFRPGDAFARLDRLLRPGGWLGVMTELFTGEPAFERWRYARDPTHASFYQARTLGWIAAHFGWRLHTPARNVALFEKPA